MKGQAPCVGPYRWVRHPLYSIGMGLFVGIGLMTASWFLLAWALLACLLVLIVVVPREERELLQKFGEDYRRYRLGTGRLFPRVLRRG